MSRALALEANVRWYDSDLPTCAPMSALDAIAEARDSAMIITVVIEHGGGRASNTAPTMYRAVLPGTESALRRPNGRDLPLPVNGRIGVAPGGDCICHAYRRPIVRPH